MTARDVAICALADLPDPGSRAFEQDGVAGFFVRRRGIIRAYRDSCPHTGAPLAWTADGYLDTEGELIQCGLHGALFKIETGECIYGPCLGQRLEILPSRIVGGQLLLLR